MKTKTEYDWITCSYCGYLYGKNSYMYKTNHYIRNLVLSWSPDHERQLTFRSQYCLKCGDLRSTSSLGTLRVGCALGRPARTRKFFRKDSNTQV